MNRHSVIHSTAIDVLINTPESSIDLVYVDPPFGTGQLQTLNRKKNGNVVGSFGYDDPNVDYVEWLKTHVEAIRHVLKPMGTLYLHLDHHWVHYAKVMCDEVFGRQCFLNEVIWSYDFGGRGKRSWPKKHDSILVYVKDADQYVFNWDDIDRIPYKAPEMQRVGRTPEEAAVRILAGKVPTDVWEMSIVGTNSKERLGWPTQKPVKLIERAIVASSPIDGVVMDVFAGSGTTGQAAHNRGRRFVLVDRHPLAIEMMRERFRDLDVNWK